MPPFLILKSEVMKPLNKLNNVEKGKLLFELFPEEMPMLVAFIKEFTQSIINDPGQIKSKANRPNTYNRILARAGR